MAETEIIKGIGVSTMGGSPNMEALPAFLDRAVELGVDYVELSLCDEDIVAGGRILPDKLARLKSLIETRPLRYSVHGPIAINFMDWMHLDLHKQVCRAFLQLCGGIGAEVMVIHSGIVKATTQGEHARLYDIQRDALAEMGDAAAAAGVRLCVENVFVYGQDEHTAAPDHLAAELAAVGHDWVRGTLDFGHARIQTQLLGQDYGDACRAFAPQVGHLHVHDCFGTPRTIWTPAESENLAYGLGDLHAPLGWGDMQWEEVFPTLPLQPGTILMLEIQRRYWAELAACVDRARVLRDMLEARTLAA
ncbi:sugar phosphate isomerase/epimerase family protein [Pelagibius sp.]|uniref:sugar phosphate isomerase/epimerase family protein n=1 Tax=Pelagibius sp. TaxID=1931238 RepID=UPI003B503D09